MVTVIIINRFHPTTVLCLSQARTCISNAICCTFVCSMIWGERWLLVLMILVACFDDIGGLFWWYWWIVLMILVACFDDIGGLFWWYWSIVDHHFLNFLFIIFVYVTKIFKWTDILVHKLWFNLLSLISIYMVKRIVRCFFTIVFMVFDIYP
jgi:hypothetical protein